MATHGIVNIRTSAYQTFAGGSTISLNFGDFYVSLVKFLTSSYAQQLGIELVAYNTGSSALGRGDDYWDTTNTHGNNAWSCWRFSSSSIPFYLLAQVSTTAGTFGQAPGNPGGSSTTGFGIAVALRADGGNPWNGTTNKNGIDRKDVNQVWNSGSSDLFVYPRSNSFGGTFALRKENVIGAGGNSGAGAVGSYMHFVADENNFVFVTDSSGDGSCVVTYFGKYTPRSGASIAVPYVCISNHDSETRDPIFISSIVFGETTGATSIGQGGIAHPWIPASGTRSVQVSGLNEFWNTTCQPNTALANPQFDEFPILCGVSEYPYHAYTGQFDYSFIRYIYGLNTGDASPDLSRAVFGNGSTLSTKVSIPWGGAVLPYATNSRTGVMF